MSHLTVKMKGYPRLFLVPLENESKDITFFFFDFYFLTISIINTLNIFVYLYESFEFFILILKLIIIKFNDSNNERSHA